MLDREHVLRRNLTNFVLDWSVLLLCNISLYSAVKQWLKCNTGKVFNCLDQFLLTVVLSIEERVCLVEYVFREGNRYTDLVQEQFC